MKTTLFTILRAAILLLSLAPLAVMAQNGALENKYRVSAVMKGSAEISSLSNTVQLKAPLSFYVPNAFSPNGDGLNDTFGVIGEGIVAYNLQIFNRWGNLIFETNDPKVQWDGTYNHIMAEPGVYVYHINVASVQIPQNKVSKTGSVLLLAS